MHGPSLKVTTPHNFCQGSEENSFRERADRLKASTLIKAESIVS